MDTSFEDAQILWEDVVALAREYQDDPTLAAWVERLLPLSFDGKSFVAVAKQRWTEQKVMTSYKGIIESLLKEITLEDIVLSVVVDAAYFSGNAAPSIPAGATTPAFAESAPSQPHQNEPMTPQSELPSVVREPEKAQHAINTQASAPAAPAPQQPYASQVKEDESETSSEPAVQPADVTQEGISYTAQGVATASGTRGLPLSEYTFDTFIVGDANRLAFDVARAAAEGDRLPGNPIFLYSKSGLGKTHLLFSILNYVSANRPDTEVVYATSNGFVEDYVDEMFNKKYRGKEVMKKYRNCDILLIDDVQFFTRKQESAVTFFDIFNQLINEGKTIVLTADEPPDYLQLDERMKTRFNMGTVIDIATPSYELKRHILQYHYERRRALVSWLATELTSSQLDTIAELSPNNIREMQGFLTKVMMQASTGAPTPLDEDDIRAIHDELFRINQSVSIATIVRVVSKKFGVSEEEMTSPKRSKPINEARQVSMWLARQMTDDSYSSIGRHFNRDHSTVYNAIANIERRSQSDRSFMNMLESLEKTIKAR